MLLSRVDFSFGLEEFSDLWPQLDLVVDGGRIGGDSGDDESQISRAGSTVVDLSPAVRSQGQRLHYRILRDGRYATFTVSFLDLHFIWP